MSVVDLRLNAIERHARLDRIGDHAPAQAVRAESSVEVGEIRRPRDDIADPSS